MRGDVERAVMSAALDAGRTSRNGSIPAMFDSKVHERRRSSGAPAEMTKLAAPDALQRDTLAPKGRDLPSPPTPSPKCRSIA